MILGDYQDPNNYVELALWIPSLVGLWLMKKWGAALDCNTMRNVGNQHGNRDLLSFTRSVCARELSADCRERVWSRVLVQVGLRGQVQLMKTLKVA
jgi:hypothetical protein